MKPRISVCIATYNGSRYIKEQLESILKQLNSDDEVIISDDKSTDRTLEIIKEFGDPRIKIYDENKFGSPVRNFENAIEKATGEYIFLSDQDDQWVENKVKIMLTALKDFDLVVSNAFIGDESLNIIRDSYFEWRNSRVGIVKNFIKNSYLGCCMAFKKKILDVVLPFPKNIPMHDMWIGIVVELYYKPVFIQEKLIIYRRHDGNATFLNEDYTSNESLISKLRFRYNLLIAVIGRSINIKLK